MKLRFLSSVVFASALLVGSSHAQLAMQPEPERPLPNVIALMHEVEEHQRAAEGIEKDYIYHSVQTFQNGGKRPETREYDVFWLNGVQVEKLTRKDGRDLTPVEQKKENDRLDKEVAKAKERKAKAEAKGQQTDPQGYEVITVSRFLELGSFSNPRRVQIDGRDNIAIDYAGDPKARTRNRSEEVVRNLAGTVWIDEQDRILTRAEGRFINNFKIGAGLVMNIKKDTTFRFDQKKINGEVWLPAHIEGHGAARVLLFVSFEGSIGVTESDYRKFKATSTILPGVEAVGDPGSPDVTPKATDAPGPQ